MKEGIPMNDKAGTSEDLVKNVSEESKKILEELMDRLDSFKPDKIQKMSKDEYQAAQSRVWEQIDKGYLYMKEADKKLEEKGQVCAPDSYFALLKLWLFMLHAESGNDGKEN